MAYRLLPLVLGVGLALGPLTAQSTHADVISTFDTSDEGWAIYGDAQGSSAAPTYQSTGGNPGGHIQATDNVAGGTWYFAAPDKFLGDQSTAYGNTLSFDLKQSGTHSQFDNSDLVLAGGGTTIAFNTANNPGTSWTPYTVTLDETAGWTLNNLSGADATQSDIQTVLADLTALRIRGEYISGSDTGDLDNVVLVPEPATVGLLGLGTLALLRRRRQA